MSLKDQGKVKTPAGMNYCRGAAKENKMYVNGGEGKMRFGQEECGTLMGKAERGPCTKKERDQKGTKMGLTYFEFCIKLDILRGQIASMNTLIFLIKLVLKCTLSWLLVEGS